MAFLHDELWRRRILIWVNAYTKDLIFMIISNF